MADTPLSSHFFTNREGNTLIKEFEGILSNNPQVKNLDAVVGFLRASGYFILRPFLDGISKVRILIGIDVDKYIATAHQKGELFFGAEEEVKEECLRTLRHDIEQSHYSRQVEDGMLQMVQDMIDGKLELRAHPSKKIHAKLYILYPDNFNQHTFGAAITGSSNLSGNGLGVGEEHQYEFNVKLTQFEDVAFAKHEFDQLWEEARSLPISAEKLAREKKVDELKRKKRRLRNELDDREEEVSEQRRAMIAELEQRMVKQTEQQNLFVIRWKVKEN